MRKQCLCSYILYGNNKVDECQFDDLRMKNSILKNCPISVLKIME